MPNIARRIIIIAISCIFICACVKNPALHFSYNESSEAGYPYPDVSFAVISDTHLYDPALGSSGPVFERALSGGRLLFMESIELFDYAAREITIANPRFVLVTGDFTKDGELVNHLLAARKLKRFTEAGIAVYVVPGNHDINNPGAVRYDEDGTSPVSSISAADFVKIYGNFGFNNALTRDTHSLSYVAEPVEGLWLLAVDTSLYRENKTGKQAPVHGGISQDTANWITGVLRDADNAHKAVMVIMHQGAAEHWRGQAKLHPDYLINDYANFGKFLASWNVRIVFSGHYHAQDITRADFDDKFLYDIETGSLISAPCPVRYVTVKQNVMDINTDTIIDKIRPGSEFALNARASAAKSTMFEEAEILRNYKLSPYDTVTIATAMGAAFTAHYAGDENPALRRTVDRRKLRRFWSRFIFGRRQYILDGLWTDLPPADNKAHLDL